MKVFLAEKVVRRKAATSRPEGRDAVRAKDCSVARKSKKLSLNEHQRVIEEAPVKVVDAEIEGCESPQNSEYSYFSCTPPWTKEEYCEAVSCGDV